MNCAWLVSLIGRLSLTCCPFHGWSEVWGLRTIEMATTLSRGQQIGGLFSILGLLLLIGVVFLVGGTAGGWFSGDNEDHTSQKNNVRRFFFSLFLLTFFVYCHADTDLRTRTSTHLRLLKKFFVLVKNKFHLLFSFLYCQTVAQAISNTANNL